MRCTRAGLPRAEKEGEKSHWNVHLDTFDTLSRNSGSLRIYVEPMCTNSSATTFILVSSPRAAESPKKKTRFFSSAPFSENLVAGSNWCRAALTS